MAPLLARQRAPSFHWSITHLPGNPLLLGGFSCKMAQHMKNNLPLSLSLYGDRSKGPCKEFSLQRPFMYVHVMLGTLAKVGYYYCNHIAFCTYATCKGLPPPAARGSGRRRVPENFGLVLVQFTVWSCTPDIYLSSFQSWGFAPAWSTSLLALPTVIFLFEVFKKQTPNVAAKLPKVWLCQSQTQGPWCLLFLS